MSLQKQQIMLNGEWDFAYQMERPDAAHPAFPKGKEYQIKLQVPGYWDDQKARLRYTDFWSRGVRFNPEYREIDAFPLGLTKPPDASLPYILGTGWYRKKLSVDGLTEDSWAQLRIGGAALETWLWVNGQFAGYHSGYMTAFSFDLSGLLRIGEENELLLAVSNLREDRTGCSIRGYKGKSAGITGDIVLEYGREARLADCHVYPDKDLQKLCWEVRLAFLCAKRREEPLIGNDSKSERLAFPHTEGPKRTAQVPTIEQSVAEKKKKGTKGEELACMAEKCGGHVIKQIADREIRKDTPLSVKWAFLEKETGRTVFEGQKALSAQEVENDLCCWETETGALAFWSDREPKLYTLRLELWGQEKLDVYERTAGIRRMDTEGRNILLNGCPIFLRGATDHAYFPETCTVPTEFAFYYETLAKLRELGFNWIRFHTWMPPEACLDAADRLGMLLQVEAANGFSEEEWLDMLMAGRRHPSVALYCCGNEVAIDERMLEYLERMQQHVKRLAPDTLFDPMEGLRAIEYELDEKADGYTTTPFPHNAKRLKALQKFSDVLAPHGSIFSYHSLGTDQQLMEERLSMITRPSLMHEVGINDSFLNLDLEKRYEGTRIGTALYAAARAYLAEKGLLQNASRYYQNSCRWMLQVTKFALEQARRTPGVSGYDLLGAIDCHWHRSGYAVGLMNEFYELKAGISTEAVRRFNGENILLSDCGVKRNLQAGTGFTLNLWVSLYGEKDLENACLHWEICGEDGTVYRQETQCAGAYNQASEMMKLAETTEFRADEHVMMGVKAAKKEENRVSGRTENQELLHRIRHGQVSRIGRIETVLPQVAKAEKLLIKVSLFGSGYSLENCWDYWIFPEVKAQKGADSCEKIVQLFNGEKLDEETLTFAEQGGRVLVLGDGGFPTLATTFQIMSGGRVQGNSATVIYDHPALRDIPHEGFCDWQFAQMMEGGRAVVFDELGIPFRPLIEVSSGYKLIRKQAALFELRVGRGIVMVCTLKLTDADPCAVWLKSRLEAYLLKEKTEDITPPYAIQATSAQLLDSLAAAQDVAADFSTDEGFDDGGHVKSSLGI